MATRPRGTGYMPKGGVHAAQAHNQKYQQEQAAAAQAAAVRVQPVAAPVAVAAAAVAGPARGSAWVRLLTSDTTVRFGAGCGFLALVIEVLR